MSPNSSARANSNPPTDGGDGVSDSRHQRERHDTPLLGEPLLTPDDVATLLGIKRSTVYELTRTGRIPSLRIGRAVRFLRADLEAWLDEQRSTIS